MAIVMTPGNPFGIALCEALGIDASLVVGIELKSMLNEVVTVKVTRYVEKGNMERVTKVLELGEWKEQGQ